MRKIAVKFLCLLMVVLMLFGLCGCSNKKENYELGIACIEAGRALDAIKYLGPLGNYKDTKTHLNTLYFEAVNLYEAGEYKDANAAFTALAEYKIADSVLYKGLSGAFVSLLDFDAVNAYTTLMGLDQSDGKVLAAITTVKNFCFDGTLLLRPDYISATTFETISNKNYSLVNEDVYYDIEYLYSFSNSSTSKSVFTEYREYCHKAFPEMIDDTDEGNYYFYINYNDPINGNYHICVSDFYYVDGGVVVALRSQ